MEIIYYKEKGQDAGVWIPVRLLGWSAQTIFEPKSTAHKTIGPVAIVMDGQGAVFFMSSHKFDFKFVHGDETPQAST